MREPLLRIRFLTRVVVVMLSMVRAILYRMVKSPSNWAYTCAMVGCSCILAFAIWLSQQPSLGLGSIIEGNLSQMSILQIFGYSFVSGSFISMLEGVYIASFFSADFKTGYIKNYIQASGGRFAYLVAAVIASLVAVIWFMVVGVFSTSISLFVVGQDYQLPTLEDAFLWFAQVVVVITAYMIITLLVVIITKNSTAGVIAGILLGGGAVETILNLVLSNIPGMPYAVQMCMNNYLSMDLTALVAGDLTGTNAFLDGGITLAVVVVLAALVMRRRSLA